MDLIRTRGRRATALAAATTALVLASSGVAFADIVENNVVVGGNDSIVAGGSTTITYQLQVQGTGIDGEGGCNATEASPATVTLSVPAGVTADKTSFKFTNCADRDLEAVKFSSTTAGTYLIKVASISDPGTGSYTNTADFTLKVSAPAPSNTKPAVTLTGAVDGANYEIGSEPTPTCNVSDTEDGASTKAAVVTGGPLTNGIGQLTATCDYIDQGGLAADTKSVTYTIVDTVKPTISVASVTPVANDFGWRKTDVTVTFSCADGGSGIESCTLPTTVGEGAAQSVVGTATDWAGNTATATAGDINVDKTAPVVTDDSTTTAPSGTAGSNNWFRSDVTVTFRATDNLSGFAGAANPHTFTHTTSGDGSAVTVTSGTVKDRAGNTSNEVTSQAFKIDTVAPSVGAPELSSTANAADWHKAPVTATFTATDGTSGVAGDTTKTVSTTADGTTTLLSPEFSDVAGNTTAAGAKEVTVNVDTGKPTISVASVTPVANDFGWRNTDVTVTFSCADGGSGIDSCTPAITVGEGAAQSVVGTATDRAGNTASVTVGDINVDKTAPVITNDSAATAPSGIAGSNGWFRSDVTVTFRASDDLSGFDGPADPHTFTRTTSGDGSAVTVTSGTVKDRAGNTSNEVTSQAFKIDTVAPSVGAPKLSSTANAAGWHKTPVTATFTATDGTSGVAGDTTKTVSTTADGTTTLLSPEFSDVAGNTTAAGAKEVTVNVDTVAPSVALKDGPVAGGVYYFGKVPAAPTCTANDETSGLDGTCSISGYAIGVGTHTVIAKARDNAGHTSTDERTYTVKAWSLSGFYSPVDMGNTVNTVKAGSTVPLKFEMFAGATELTSVSDIASFKAATVGCGALTGTVDEIELVSTGGTSLRYDSTGGQFIQNWKLPTGAGICYKATMTAQDGSSLSAYFKTK